MTRLLPDPELDRMVRELNEHNAAAAATATVEVQAETVSQSPWPAAQVPSGNPLEALLIEVARRGASDLLLIAGAPPVFRVGGHLLRGTGTPFSGDEVARCSTHSSPRASANGSGRTVLSTFRCGWPLRQRSMSAPGASG